MNRINWGRVLGGGLLAALILFLTDGFLHEQVLGGDWEAVYAQFIPLGFYSVALWIKVAAFQLVPSIAAAFAGAAPYREP